MSEKKAKTDRKLKVMAGEADARKMADEQAKSIRKMYEDRDKKALSAKDHLVKQLEVTVDKYRTANGVMSALETLRAVAGKHEMTIEEEIGLAKTIATTMATNTQKMASKAWDLDPEQMDQLCEGFYDKEFSESDSSALDMTVELMSLQLCQNVGPDAGDIVEFLRHAGEEIEKAKQNLETFCKENDLDFFEVCGEEVENFLEACEEKKDECLCDSCILDCKDTDKHIKVGDSAREVCDNFIADLNALE